MAWSQGPLTAIAPPAPHGTQGDSGLISSAFVLCPYFQQVNEPLWFLHNKLVALNCIISIAILFMVATTYKRPKGSSVTEIHIGIRICTVEYDTG